MKHLVSRNLLAFSPNVRPSLLPNTSITTIQVDSLGKGMVTIWGDVSHLSAHGPVEKFNGQTAELLLDLSGGE